MKKLLLTTIFIVATLSMTLNALNTTANSSMTTVCDNAPCGGKCGEGKCGADKCGAGKCNSGK